MTKRIVEAQGGRVEVASVLGKGSTFCAIVPRNLLPQRPPGESSQAPRPLSVLVFEPDATTCAWLSEVLVGAGYQVDSAQNLTDFCAR